ncbi:MAG: alpha-ketoacid dehydrogenase subunit beta [Dehalococcoidia bacterium]|nr:alpha-ketoacid dehydrogenase subunit beta [Dehalococcoidia bacterium]
MRELHFVHAINEALRQEMERDPTVFIAGEDIGAHGGAFGATAALHAEYGDTRVVDTPISESAIIGLAVGAAVTGMRPVVEIMFMDFIGCCFDEILNQMAKMKYMFGGKARLPIVVRSAFGGGFNLAAQHSQSLEALLCHIPGLLVVMPSSATDAKGLLISAIRDDNPVIFLEHKGLYRKRSDVPEEPYVIPFGSAEVKRQGHDVTVIATARMVHEALKAAHELSEQGIEVEVVDPRSLVPLDVETMAESVRKTHRLVVAHEAVRDFGIGAEIVARLSVEAFDYLDAPPLRVGAPYSPVPFSPALEKEWLPGSDEIVAAVREVVPSRAPA